MNNKLKQEQIFKNLEAKMTSYRDLISIPVRENGEPLSILKPRDNLMLFNTILEDDLPKFTKTSKIIVRKTVVKKLEAVAETLNRQRPNHNLSVVYGYRSLQTQKNIYEKFKKEFSKKYTEDELEERIHKYIANPSVAGHPTGGAIDVVLSDTNGTNLDFGSPLWVFTKQAYVFNPFVSVKAWNNRMFLRKLMLEQNFAPFDGEWWHFSYGDREWAYYYKKPEAIFRQITTTRILHDGS